MADRDDLARVLAVPSVHHPMFCDCDGDVRCDGLMEQVDALLAVGWVPATTMTGAGLIAAERRRQVEVEGFTPEHDRDHGPERLRRAASCYYSSDMGGWPFEPGAWKPRDWLSNLIRAGALYLAAAEVDDSGEPSGMARQCADEIDGILARVREPSGG